MYKPLQILIVVLAVLAISFQPAYNQKDGDSLVIGRYRTLHSDILKKDRILLVSLPDDYENGNSTYPVIIKLFGTPPEYFSNITSTLKMLSTEGLIPECIFIGVDQHGHGEVIPPSIPVTQYPNEGDKFLEFVGKELIPFIDRNYRTNGFRIFMGSYECGVFGLYALLNDPGLFNVYLINSPGRYGGSTAFLETAENEIRSKDFTNRFLHMTYTDQESEDLTRSNTDFIVSIDDNSRPGLTFSSTLLKGGEFDGLTPYIYCKGSFMKVFDGYACPPDVCKKGLEAVRKYFYDLSNKLGYDITLPERILDNTGNAVWQAGNTKDAEQAFRMMIEKYPRSLNGYFRMGDLTRSTGRYEEAVSYYQKCLDLNPNIDIFRIRKEQAEKLLKDSRK